METTKIVSSRSSSSSSSRQQLTMTVAVGAEEIEDGLAAPRRLPPKHSASQAGVARVT